MQVVTGPAIIILLAFKSANIIITNVTTTNTTTSTIIITIIRVIIAIIA